ncbi:YfhO family protein, partial [Patescibacteria group bacterium]
LILKNYHDFYLSAFTDYDTSDFHADQMPPMNKFETSALDYLNISYIYGKGDMTISDPNHPERFNVVYDNPYRWFRVIDNRSVAPRFFFVLKSVSLPNKATVLDAISNDDYDLKTTALYTNESITDGEEEIKYFECENGNFQSIQVLFYKPSHIKLEVDSACTADLVSSEPVYPGWKAYIDGKKVDIKTVNSAFRAVELPAGKHVVEMRYEPWIYLYGGIVTIGTLFGCWVVLKKYG